MTAPAIVAATGHRPDKLGGYSAPARGRLVAFAESILPRYAPDKFIVGMALGWDTACALACISLGIPIICAVPFEGQESQWPADSQRVYQWVLAQAAEVVVVTPGGYSKYAMHARNRWMVDRCGSLLALWDGSKGGTSNCLSYADSSRKLYSNPYHEWLRWVETHPLDG